MCDINWHNVGVLLYVYLDREGGHSTEEESRVQWSDEGAEYQWKWNEGEKAEQILEKQCNKTKRNRR